MEGVFKNGPILDSNVNHTWMIRDEQKGGSHVTMQLQWPANEEQTGFDRTQSYISRLSICPLPHNCSGSFYDADIATSAVSVDPQSYRAQRTNVDSFSTDSFIVTSSPFVYTFTNNTGNGNWSDSLNWTPGIPAPYIIRPGMEVVIDPPGNGECVSSGDIQIIAPGRLTIRQGKKLRVVHQ